MNDKTLAIAALVIISIGVLYAIPAQAKEVIIPIVTAIGGFVTGQALGK